MTNLEEKKFNKRVSYWKTVIKKNKKVEYPTMKKLKTHKMKTEHGIKK
ncbi:hypothetical protein OIU78_009624 [Salix suchowensis]|nr:hypothetical protein OIU78_009624 [Salix suchowensis]